MSEEKKKKRGLCVVDDLCRWWPLCASQPLGVLRLPVADKEGGPAPKKKEKPITAHSFFGCRPWPFSASMFFFFFNFPLLFLLFMVVEGALMGVHSLGKEREKGVYFVWTGSRYTARGEIRLFLFVLPDSGVHNQGWGGGTQHVPPSPRRRPRGPVGARRAWGVMAAR